MTIQYYSDLHLEFAANNLYLHMRPIPPIGEILILAGDITYWNKDSWNNPFFDDISRKFNTVYYVPGNHEYYLHKNARHADKSFKIPIRENVFLVNNISEVHGDVELFFSTLWTKIPEHKSFMIQELINDYHRITYDDRAMTVEDSNRLHHNSLQWLGKALTESKANKKVVATHHVPSQICVPEKFRGSNLNDAFTVELGMLIIDHEIDYWIYGHQHYNTPEMTIHKTKLVTNQLGYREYEKLNLDIEAIIEI